MRAKTHYYGNNREWGAINDGHVASAPVPAAGQSPVANAPVPAAGQSPAPAAGQSPAPAAGQSPVANAPHTYKYGSPIGAQLEQSKAR